MQHFAKLSVHQKKIDYFWSSKMPFGFQFMLLFVLFLRFGSVCGSVHRTTGSAEPPNLTEPVVLPNYRTEPKSSVEHYFWGLYKCGNHKWPLKSHCNPEGLWVCCGGWEACGVCQRRVGFGAKSVGDFGNGMGCRSALLSGCLGKSGHLPRWR